MTDSTQKQQSEMETKARIIGNKLTDLWKKIDDSKEKESIAVNEIVFIMEFMSKQFGTSNSHLFQNHFLGHLKLFSELLPTHGNSTDKFVKSFEQLTKILCEVIMKDEFRQGYLRRLLKAWLRCLERSSSPRKVDATSMQNCGKFLIEATSYSMQMRMLNIICLYLSCDDDMDINPFAFIDTFKDINVTTDTTKALNKIINKKTALTFTDKHQLLELINGCSEKRSVYSIPVKSLSSMEILVADTGEGNSGWMNLNTMSNTVEIWLTTNDKPKKVLIKSEELEAIVLIVPAKASFITLKFEQNSSSSQHKSNQEGKVNMKTHQSIDVTVNTNKHKLIKLLHQTFPKINVKVEQDCESNATTFCSALEDATIDGTSAANDDQLGRTPSATKLLLYNDKKISTQPNDSTFYDESNGAANIQKNVVSTMRKRLPVEDVQPVKHDALTMEKRLRSLQSSTDNLMHDHPHQTDNGTSRPKEVMQAQIFNRDDNNIEMVENELDKIINTAKRALALAKATKRT